MTSDVTDAPRPGTRTPASAPEYLRPLGANEFFPRSWEYRHPKHTLEDFMRPGYMTGEARALLRPGDDIFYVLGGGKPAPSDWQRGLCTVEEVPNSSELPVILAGYHRFSSATPWRIAAPDAQAAEAETRTPRKPRKAA